MTCSAAPESISSVEISMILPSEAGAMMRQEYPRIELSESANLSSQLDRSCVHLTKRILLKSRSYSVATAHGACWGALSPRGGPPSGQS